jgi:hypothetical protein
MFTLSFNVLNATIASNLVLHRYHVYVEYVNSTIGPKKIVGTWVYSGSDFAVYTADQAASMQITQKYSGVSSPVFTYPAAKAIWANSQLEMDIGARSYMMGDFTGAKTHYQNADNLAQQALQTEQTEGTAIVNSQTSGLTMQGYGYLFLGVGLTLFGIGAILFAIHRRST